MKQKELSELTDQELLEESKRLKSFSLINAFYVGFLLGIVLYSLIKNSWGFLTLIPLYLIYRFTNDPKAKRSRELEQMIKERKLK